MNRAIKNFTQLLASESANGEGMTHVEVELSVGDSISFADNCDPETGQGGREGRLRFERVGENDFIIEVVTSPRDMRHAR